MVPLSQLSPPSEASKRRAQVLSCIRAFPRRRIRFSVAIPRSANYEPMPPLKVALPPPDRWQDFEDLCCDLFRRMWSDPGAQKHGRQGEAQRGVDIFGQPDRGPQWEGVQCKAKSKGKQLDRQEVEDEVHAALRFQPGLRKLTVATTAPRSVSVQEFVREISGIQVERGSFPVSVWAWEDLLEELWNYPTIINRYFADYLPDHRSFSILFRGSEVRITDSRGAQSVFSSRVPGISAAEVERTRRDGRSWKAVHKLAEQMFSRARVLEEAFQIYKRHRNVATRDSARRILSTSDSDLRRIVDELEAVMRTTGSLEFLDFLLGTWICLDVMRDALAAQRFDAYTASAVLLIEWMVSWYHQALVIADGMLEKFFDEHG